YPTWLRILNHSGSGLDEAIKSHPWAIANGILTGGDYLKCWIASLIQKPTEPLPYLFFYGDQGAGKSIIHEALSTLFKKGYVLAKQSVTSDGGFSGELNNAILCVLEEIDLNKDKRAYGRIKDWVTARQILIHPK